MLFSNFVIFIWHNCLWYFQWILFRKFQGIFIFAIILEIIITNEYTESHFPYCQWDINFCNLQDGNLIISITLRHSHNSCARIVYIYITDKSSPPGNINVLNISMKYQNGIINLNVLCEWTVSIHHNAFTY